DACAFAAAYALRERFPLESFSQTVWSRKSWSEGEIAELLAVVEQRVRAAAASLVPAQASPPRRPRTTIPTATEWGAFAPWAHFIDRGSVLSAPGVYVFAQHEDELPEAVDPVARDVIYVGMTARSLAFRLVQFEQTALGGRGHTGGWSYRHEIARGDWDRLVAFRDTYVTWCPVGGGGTAPRGVERSLLAHYERRWGALPRLNKAR